MLWDASLDQNNMINGKRYSEHIASIIGEGGPTVQIKVPVTLPQHSTTSKPSESTTSKPSESSTNEPKEETTGSKPEETSHPIIPSKKAFVLTLTKQLSALFITNPRSHLALLSLSYL